MTPKEECHPKNAKRLLEFVPIQPGQTILDLAMGTGLVAIPVAKAVEQGRFSDWCRYVNRNVSSSES